MRQLAHALQSIPPAEARALVLDRCAPLPAEPVPLTEALGRRLAIDARCDQGIPRFATALMDGYALRAGDTPARLPVRGEARAGQPHGAPLEPGTSIAIATGAPLPEGADAVVPFERTREHDGEIEVDAAVEPGSHLRPAGAELAPRATAVRAGTALGAEEIGLLAACGVAAPACHRRPAVAVVTTGDELVPPGEPLGPGQVWDSNALLLAALAAEAGATVGSVGHAPDDPVATHDALADAFAADLVLACGGISVGRHDQVKPALAALGVAEVFWGVAMRPGRMSWFGVRDETLVFGLPGKPASARAAFELLVRPALDALGGRRG